MSAAERPRDARGRFLPVGSTYQPLPLGALVEVCQGCGALVVDRTLHDAHHDLLRRQTR